MSVFDYAKKQIKTGNDRLKIDIGIESSAILYQKYLTMNSKIKQELIFSAISRLPKIFFF